MPKELLYSIPVRSAEKIDGETVPYKSAILETDEDITLYPSPNLDTIKKIFYHSVEEYATEAFLGTRSISGYKEEKPIFGKYNYKTYDEICLMAECLAKAISQK